MFSLDNRSGFRRRHNGKDSPGKIRGVWNSLREQGALGSIAIAIGFWVCLVGLFVLRRQVVPYRPGQYVPYDITARVGFDFFDQDTRARQENEARDNAPHVYRQVSTDVWNTIEQTLLRLPDRVEGRTADQLDDPYRDILDNGSITALDQDRTGVDGQRYEDDVRQFVAYSRTHLLSPDGGPLVILNQDDYQRETSMRSEADESRKIVLIPATPDVDAANLPPASPERLVDVATQTYGSQLPDSVSIRLNDYAKGFDLGLGKKIAAITEQMLAAHPLYMFDDAASAQQKNAAVEHLDPRFAYEQFLPDEMIVPRGIITDRDWQILRDENEAYHKSLSANGPGLWQYRFGLVLLASIVTLLLSAYVVRYQRRCVRNHWRAASLCMLLLSMLFLSQLAGITNNSLYFFGITPTILAAIIITIAYDQRFALGVTTIHSLVVTASLNQDLGFFLIVWVGVLTACYLLDDIRTRSKLIELGGVTALAMIVVTAAVGAVHMEPKEFIWTNCLYVGAAGLIAGFIVLGILPFIEKTFRITTSMTLLELADATQPLLRRLALEAPGTYNHSLQVATLAEAAAEEIRVNSLLCRVGSYYHDIGKIIKPDYFVENQGGGENRHLNLSPTLSLRIIISHVKDGVEMAKQYNLPTSIFPIIQQHHGTTVVEYFFHQAMQQSDEGSQISDTEFRYPGPKPKSKESAIVMVADAVESASRSMAEPTTSRIEALVHEMCIKRMQDGQFDECDLTMRELELIERSIAKTLAGFYHARIAYPTKTISSGVGDSSPVIKSA